VIHSGLQNGDSLEAPQDRLLLVAQARPRRRHREGRQGRRNAQSFTEADKDRFLEDAFAYMARFFENSLGELQERNASIETSFRRIDANRFTGVIYRDGKAAARCKIVLGGMFGRGISFSYNDQASDNSSNENMSVDADDHGLYLGFSHISARPRHPGQNAEIVEAYKKTSRRC
jgi:hypothetical protein